MISIMYENDFNSSISSTLQVLVFIGPIVKYSLQLKVFPLREFIFIPKLYQNPQSGIFEPCIFLAMLSV